MRECQFLLQLEADDFKLIEYELDGCEPPFGRLTFYQNRVETQRQRNMIVTAKSASDENWVYLVCTD